MIISKSFNKVCAVVVSIIMTAGFVFLFGACGTTIDRNKTQLYIGHYDGGYGTKWLESIKVRFEEKYKDMQLEPGKTGVEVWIENDKDTYIAPALENVIGTSHIDVFFPQGNDVSKLLEKGLLLDLSDMVKENMLEKHGENNSVESKIPESVRSNFMMDGRYYSLPHNDSILGMVYDIDLFDVENLFFAKNGAPSENLQREEAYPKGSALTDFNYSWTGLSGTKSAGPDGQYNTYDDGLPATYDEFFELCSRMKNVKSFSPISWTGQYSVDYSLFLAKALWADYEGAANIEPSYLSGLSGNKEIDIVDFDSDGKMKFEDGKPVIVKETVNGVEDYSVISKQPGFYYALKFWEQIVSGNYYYYLSTDQFQSHVMAQLDFLESRFINKPIGMILEGSWWENEAVESMTFANLTEKHGANAAKEKRKFAFMPMPKATSDKVGHAVGVQDGKDKYSVIYASPNSCFINANIPEYKKQLALDFLQFATTDISLNHFIRDTGSVRAYDYEVDNNIYQDLSYFSRSVIDMVNNSITVRPYVSTLELRKNIEKKYNGLMSFQSIVDGQLKNVLLNSLRSDHLSAEVIFEGMYRYSKSA